MLQRASQSGSQSQYSCHSATTTYEYSLQQLNYLGQTKNMRRERKGKLAVQKRISHLLLGPTRGNTMH